MFNLVVDSDGFVEVLDLVDVEDGGEGLFLGHREVAGALDDGGLDVPRSGDTSSFVLREVLATDEDLAALSSSLLDGVEVLVDGHLIVEGTNEVALDSGVTDLELLVEFDKLGEEVVVDLFVEAEAAEGGAALTTGTDGTEEDGVHGHLEVSIFEDDEGVVTTEFEDALAEAASDFLVDLAADVARAGEGDEVDIIGANNFLSNTNTTGAEGGDGAEAVAGEDAVDDVLGGNTAEVGGFSTLPDLSVTSDQVDGGIPAGDGDGEVEGGDDTESTEGVPLLHHEVSRAFRGDDLAGELTAETSSKVADVDVLLDFTDTFGVDLTDFKGEGAAEGLEDGAELLTNFTDDLTADGGGGELPVALGGLDVGDGAAAVFFGTDLDGEVADLLAVDGGDDGDDGAGGLPFLTVEAARVDAILDTEGFEEGEVRSGSASETRDTAAEHFLFKISFILIIQK